MQITIDMYKGTNEIDYVTVTASGSDSKKLLARVMRRESSQEELQPLQEAVKLIREMSEAANRLIPADKRLADPNTYPRNLLGGVADLLEHLANGERKIQCIKIIREQTGLGLKDAKETIERTKVFAP